MKYKSTQFLYTYTVSYSTMELHPSQMVYSTQFLFVFLTQIVQISIKNIWWPFNIKVNSLDQNIDFFYLCKTNMHCKISICVMNIGICGSLSVGFLFYISNIWMSNVHISKTVISTSMLVFYFFILNIWMFTFPKCVFLPPSRLSILYFKYLNVHIPKMCIFTFMLVFYFLFWISECWHSKNVHFYLPVGFQFVILDIWMFTFPTCICWGWSGGQWSLCLPSVRGKNCSQCLSQVEFE